MGNTQSPLGQGEELRKMFSTTKDTTYESTEGGYNVTLFCHHSKGCSAQLPFFMSSEQASEPLGAILAREGWQEIRGKWTKYYCPKHRMVSPKERDRAKLARFIETRISLNEHDAVPTTRVWDEFKRYVGTDSLNDLSFTIGKRDVYAAVRALGSVFDGQRNLVISGKQTCTPTFEGISLKTTAGPEDHDEWFAKRKGGVLAKKREIKAADLEVHRERAERRRAAARKELGAAEHAAQFVAEHLIPSEGSKITSDQMYTFFGRYLAKNGVDRQVATKREFMALLTGLGLKARKTSQRIEGRRRPISITVYEGVSPVKVKDLPGAPSGPARLVQCFSDGCKEFSMTSVAGDLGWREIKGATYCLGHAEHQDKDPIEIIAATWPTRAPNLDRPGPRGAEIAAPVEDDIVLEEDLPEGYPPAAGAPDETLLDEFDAMPQAGVTDDLDDIVLEGEPGYDEMVAKDKENR